MSSSETVPPPPPRVGPPPTVSTSSLPAPHQQPSQQQPPLQQHGAPPKLGSRFQSLVQPETSKRRGNFESRFNPSAPSAASAPVALSLPPAPKLQYSREALLALAVRSSSYKDLIMDADALPEGVLGAEWQAPELLKPFESEEVYNNWYDVLNPTSSSAHGGGNHHHHHHHSQQQQQQQERGGGAQRSKFHGDNAPPRAVDWRKSPVLGAAKSGILPPSGGMDLEHMSLISAQFQKEMELERSGGNAASTSASTLGGFFAPTSASSSSAVMGALGNGGASILDLPLEEGLTAPPAEEVTLDTKNLTFGSVLDPWRSAAVPSSSAGGVGDVMDLLNSQNVFGQSHLSPTPFAPRPSTQLFAPQPSAAAASALPPQPPSSISAAAAAASVIAPAVQAQAPPPPVSDEWYYMDPQKAVQGPFSSKEMREWYDAGYFFLELPISNGVGSNRKFLPLSYVFPPNNGPPFTSPPAQYIGGAAMPAASSSTTAAASAASSSRSQQTAFSSFFGTPDLQQIQQQMAEQEQQRQQRQQVEMQQQRERQQQFERQQQLERQQQQEAVAAAQRAEQERIQQEQQQQFLLEEQARLLLAESNWTLPPDQPKDIITPLTAPSTAPASATATTAAATGPSKKQAKKAAAAAAAAAAATAATAPPAPVLPSVVAPVVQQQPQPPPPPAAPVVVVPAWGKAGLEGPVRAPTLKEIQEAEEEQRKQQLLHQPELHKPFSMASHVARSVGIETASAPIVVVKPSPVLASSSSLAPSVKSPAPTSKPSVVATTSSKQQPEEVQMSAEFKSWCLDHLPSNGTFSLMEICYGMDHTEDMRDILNSSLMPATFVNDFIKRAVADKVGKSVLDTSNDWISTSTPKKAAKKKQQQQQLLQQQQQKI